MSIERPSKGRKRLPTKVRVYLRLTPQDHVALMRLGVTTGRCVADVVGDFVAGGLAAAEATDYEFAKWWREERFQMALKEHAL